MNAMFRNCTTLTAANLEEFIFREDGEKIVFTQTEIDKWKIIDPSFTFENKNIKQLRNETSNMMEKYFPECLL